MNRSSTLASLLLAAVGLALIGADWPQFRGPQGRGVSQETDLPTEFDAETGKNIAWKRPLPGRGPSSPIVVEGRVLVTAAEGPDETRLVVLCFDADDGRLLWRRSLWATGHAVFHPFGGVATPTPASDGTRVVAFYSTNDLACFDLQGNLLWFRGLSLERPAARNDVGMASSPLIVGSTVVVQVENQGDSFAAGIDLATGKTRWQIPREAEAIWSSPMLLPASSGRPAAVLMQSRSRLTALEPANGQLRWEYETRCHTMASATACDGLVYLPSHGLNALKPEGPREPPELLWAEHRLNSSSPSPTIYRGRAYTIKSPGILACGDAKTGEVLWQMRLKGKIWASAAIADGHLFAVNHEGLAQVVRLDEERGEIVGETRLDAEMLASPAVADGAIYFRSNDRLWKIAK
jgi:outer membrane protein assembly factor BamB